MLDRSLNLPPDAPIFGRGDGLPAQWALSRAPVPYPEAVSAMEARAAAIADGTAGELIWLLEHPPLYTAGISAKDDDLLEPNRSPSSPAAAAGSSPITAQASGWPM